MALKRFCNNAFGVLERLFMVVTRYSKCFNDYLRVEGSGFVVRGSRFEVDGLELSSGFVFFVFRVHGVDRSSSRV